MKAKPALNEQTLSGLKWRNIGPAFTSGRIVDLAIHPEDDNVWYVAVASGGVWKTVNAGVTFTPIFDHEGSYSIGCITIDPNNPDIVWVGTGENDGGRHIAFGDGIYRSLDGGSTWKNMGLKASEHLSKIIVQPGNSNKIWVASQGPLWSPGGERGLFLSEDGGETWTKTLGDDEFTGVTDLVMDPRDPDRLYAATWQHQRTIASFMSGGPESAIHLSTDGGKTWTKLTKGLPKGNMGKICLAISPQNPDVIYTDIELDRRTGGLWRSDDRGASWSKMSDAVSGGTGPHYYQELYASPHAFDRIYLMDVRIQVSDDGGKTFRLLGESQKHSDNHAMAFRADDPDYLLVGCDGGLWETFDYAKTWRFFGNLPITQYYKVAVDNKKPFYHVFGGTQDNGSHGGPSRTDTRQGIRNADWYITLGADGYQSATEPGNPNIGYAQTQEGGLHRIDRITGEQVYIQPQPAEGEDYERYNWDAPIVVSSHDPARLYFASQRMWRSNDRGDSWTPISGDLTKDENRMELEIMGKKQSWDAPWDVLAMSNYNTIASIAESAVNENILYAGTDDGIIQVTEDGGKNWRRIDVGTLPGVPATAFVNDIKADLFDANTVYVCLDNHKSGDYHPYVVKSSDLGKTWVSLVNNLPERTLTWRLVQDPVKKELMFLATEFGVYCTINGGQEWVNLKGGLPLISFRDLAIQPEENDLVAASFGRGFFILDDYSFLRDLTPATFEEDAALFTGRPALWYRQRSVVNEQGATRYEADNPDFGAQFTYFLKEVPSTMKADRQKEEKELSKAGKDIPFPGWEKIEAEKREEAAQLWFTIKDAQGNVVQRFSERPHTGINRVNWDLSTLSKNPIPLEQRRGPGGGGGFFRRGGMMATPGTYSVSMAMEKDGEIK
ncbi:MAG: glycosyl hydrolase, partial [Saprospiraceae bacterium]|nr:glycosyl hydrolase [Saprospiraceae bacterium]